MQQCMNLSIIRWRVALVLVFFTCYSPAQISTFPYFQNFDSGIGNWTVTTINGTAWELGVPTVAGSPVPYSFPNCWGTDLDSGYRAGSVSYLTSPWFLTGSMQHPYFSFLQFRYMSVGLDGMHVEYTDNGTQWNVLGSTGSPWSSNWYNSTSIFATGLPGFTGNSNGWLNSGIQLDFLGAIDSIRFRFKFSSNTSFGSAQPGIFLDNVTFKDSSSISTDISLTGISSPLTTVAAGISQPVQIILSNVSFQSIDTFFCGYILNGIPSTPTQIVNTLAPGQTDTITVGNITLISPLNTLCTYINVPGDNNNSNDTNCININALSLVQLPYFENFDSGPGAWTQVSNPNTLWEHGTPNYLTTSSAHSGVYCWDINLNTGYGPSAYSILNSPVFDLSTAGLCRLSFWRNNDSEASWDGTRMEYTINNGITWNLLGSVSDPNATNWYNFATINSSGQPAWAGTSNGWVKSTYLLQQVLGQNNVQFRYIFTSDVSVQTQGVSIDDFSIQELPDFDAELIYSYTNSPSFPAGGMSDSIFFLIKNNGSQIFNTFTYQYAVNGIINTSALNFGNLLPGDSLLISLPGFLVNPLNQSICSKIILQNDADTSNNLFCFSVLGLPTYTPTFEDNFDNGNTGWYSENAGVPGTSWEFGVPAFGATSGTYSPPYCWDINLTSGYASSANCRLNSPIFDLSAAVHPTLSFWQNRNAEMGWDGLKLEYRNIGDTLWQVMGILNDTNAINWYNDAQLISSQSPGWTGSSSGWTPSIYNLDVLNLSNLVQFRFVFNSDFSTNTDGVSIDNFKLTTIYSNDAALLTIISPGSNAIQGTSTPVEVLLRNMGSSTLTNLDITYRHNSGIPVTFNWTGNLATDSTQLVALPPIFPVGGPNTLEVFINWSGDLYQGNDTVQTSFFGIVTAGLPYSYDFESGSNGWGANTGPGNTNWELGTPNFGPLNTTHSGNACWDINLTMPYFNLAQAVLTSPIFDINPYNIITIQFWINYSAESNADGMFVEYSTNGNTWQRLGSINDPLGTNWYNSNLYQSNEGWSGISNGWQSVSYEYTSPWGNNYLQLRFKFISDFNLVDAGFSLDDINITGVTGVSENSSEAHITIYPNPANTFSKINIQSKQRRNFQLQLLNSEGRILSHFKIGENPFEIDTRSIPEGLYLLRFTDENAKQIVKPLLIIHR
jgi:hypothetical protein